MLRPDRGETVRKKAIPYSLFCISDFFIFDHLHLIFLFHIQYLKYFTLTLFLLMVRGDRGERQEGWEKAS